MHTYGTHKSFDLVLLVVIFVGHILLAYYETLLMKYRNIFYLLAFAQVT